MLRAMDCGLILSKPLWESAPYDFIVEAANHRLSRVQVKSVGTMIRCGYAISTHGAGNRAYRRGEFDFFAAWVAPLDVWYIIPAAAVLPARSAALYPHVKGSWGKYEKYREAWRLLGIN